MHRLHKNIIILSITWLGLLGLLNVSIQFARIIDFFPGVNAGMLLAEEITETEGAEKSTESFSQMEFSLIREAHLLHSLVADETVALYLHRVELPTHPDFEKVTPPPKG